MIDNILTHPAYAAMRQYRQFIVYVIVPSQDRPGKTDKFPVNPLTGRVDASAHDPAIWYSAEEAANYARAFGNSYGVGFVFTVNDPFFFIDIDNARAGDGWNEIAIWLLGLFPGACVEISQSRQGLHIFASGQAPQHKKKNAAYGLEFYTELRFAALTGISAQGDSASVHTPALAQITAQLFPWDRDDAGRPVEWTLAPCPEWAGPVDDGELIRRAIMSRSTASSFSGKASFADLWFADERALSLTYPAANGYDASLADAALALHLMFWTGRNCERVERLMRQSKLVRGKWDHHDTYLRELTITNAFRISVDVLQDKPLPGTGTPPDTDAPRPALSDGSTFLGAEQQLQLFAGCVYVSDAHKILIPGGRLLKHEQFRAWFGGRAFTMDNNNEKTSRDAWEAFTESQIFRCPRADTTMFQPAKPPAAIETRGSRSRVNTYWPQDVRRLAGDSGPFLAHLAKILPDERDRMILLSYMAAVVQFKGYKFQWAPLLQGVEGNGKTLFTRCVAYAVGEEYCHMPRAKEIGEKFNAWLFGNIFIGVEDVFVPEHNLDLLEILKPMITGERNERRTMNMDQIMSDVVANFFFNCNNQAALKKSRNDRRIAPFFTAQQEKEHLQRDGMDGNYFPELYAWLNRDGYAIVAEYLYTFQIPVEFNPAVSAGVGAMAYRAPRTSTTDAAMIAGEGRVEQEIREAIGAGRPGFAKGWISSHMLSVLLKDIGMLSRLSPNRRREILKAMGYDWHPGLNEGRVNNDILPDNAKPRLFVVRNHPSVFLATPAEIARAYSVDQQVSL